MTPRPTRRATPRDLAATVALALGEAAVIVLTTRLTRRRRPLPRCPCHPSTWPQRWRDTPRG